VDASAALEFITETRAATGVHVTITHLVAKAVAGAIAQMPEVNGIAARGGLWLRDSVDIFLQVALDGGQSLSGATIRDADKKSVAEIAQEFAGKVEKIRSHQDPTIERTTSTLSKLPDRLLGPLMRTLAWAQYDHGLDLSKLGLEQDTFGSAMVTNVGMFGLQQGYAPAFPLGRTALVILVGEVTQKPVVVDGEIVARPVLGLHATIDHRVIDGYHAGVLAGHVREALAKPALHMAVET
jgi:pyruvate dehydrogenase E2 component (dihydrolipoamide acetyltransferase)